MATIFLAVRRQAAAIVRQTARHVLRPFQPAQVLSAKDCLWHRSIAARNTQRLRKLHAIRASLTRYLQSRLARPFVDNRSRQDRKREAPRRSATARDQILRNSECRSENRTGACLNPRRPRDSIPLQ